MHLGVFWFARWCGCQFVGEYGRCVGWSGVLPLGFPGDGGAVSVSFAFCFGFLVRSRVTLGDEGPFGVVLRLG